LVSYLHREKHQYFVAEDPGVLQQVLGEKERRVSALRAGLTGTIPVLRSMFNQAGGKPVARYYEGRHGLRTILADVLEEADKNMKEYVAYSTAEFRSPLYAAYPSFTADRIKRNIRVRVIAIGEGGYLKGLDERRWLAHDDEHKVPTYTIIYGMRVALMSAGSGGDPFGMIIEDPGIAATQLFLFDWVWGKLSP
jgi:hypothetical protein